ncbi:Transposon Tn7 transposition protein TnsB [Andreprevotia sp. IGB-42]|uniref:Mu transposase C-terminal domain-containing protein n=1 Tax=Andreprevotia sp. IGB-42 TaxID=2497473 RepID=UPI00135CE107|nr:Mu transposase C-terminal domain-containing protein [Andreprevotia sp. IGB-42]KAF0813933.1 Transposon Tn7 transposition protein TnsB [Andreprevotia sp. IGB-42]
MESRVVLLLNDLLHYADGSERTLRLIWLNPDNSGAAVIDIHDPRAWPVFTTTIQLVDDVMFGHARLLKDDPLAVVAGDHQLSNARKAARDRAWKIIAPLVRNEPAIFLSRSRGPLVSDACQLHRVPHQTVYSYLRRYWQRALSINALLFDWDRCGAKGASRGSNPAVKRGRPRKFDIGDGVNVNDDIRKVFRIAIHRYYLKGKRYSLADAYHTMIKDFFCDKDVDPDTGRVVHRYRLGLEPAGDLTSESGKYTKPTLVQFRYWYERDNQLFDIKRRRIGEKNYDKDMRGYIGTSNAEVWGPGARFQIDATIADVYLVSRLKRDRIIGRPVLYIVIDVFSRMIVGLSVGLEGPSWVGGMLALANAAEDKVNYCKRFGIQIEPEDWPCHHLPAILLGDRGEIESRYIDTLANNYRVTIENTASYRADWKGVVEQRFRLLPAKFKPYVPGYVEPDFRQRGVRDYRLDAVLDLEQFTEILIADILYYNNHHELRTYDKDRDLIADEVLAVPSDLWDWGIRNRSGCLRTYPIEGIRFHLLPTAQATVTEKGIRYDGSYYICEMALKERWLDRARQRGHWRVPISFDPRDREMIFLHYATDFQGFVPCSLTDRSRADRQISEWEIGQGRADIAARSAKHQAKQTLAKADLSAHIEEVVLRAQSQVPLSAESNLARTSKIRKNRAEERQRIADKEAFGAGISQDRKVQDNVIPLRQTASDMYSEPDITEMLTRNSQDEPSSKSDS